MSTSYRFIPPPWRRYANSSSTRCRFAWKPMIASPSITSAAVARLSHAYDAGGLSLVRIACLWLLAQ
jgi:hypothetical protein